MVIGLVSVSSAWRIKGEEITGQTYSPLPLILARPIHPLQPHPSPPLPHTHTHPLPDPGLSSPALPLSASPEGQPLYTPSAPASWSEGGREGRREGGGREGGEREGGQKGGRGEGGGREGGRAEGREGGERGERGREGRRERGGREGGRAGGRDGGRREGGRGERGGREGGRGERGGREGGRAEGREGGERGERLCKEYVRMYPSSTPYNARCTHSRQLPPVSNC